MNYQQRINLRENGRAGGAFQFVAEPTTDIITVYNGPTFVTGDEVCLYTESSTLPSPLAVTSLYYVITTSTAGQIKLASSLVNAMAGTAIDITTAGSGRHAMSRNQARLFSKIELSIRDLAKQVADSTLTLATINATDASPNITQAQLDAWVDLVRDDATSAVVTGRMETDIEAVLIREIYAQDSEIATAAQGLIKSHCHYL